MDGRVTSGWRFKGFRGSIIQVWSQRRELMTVYSDNSWMIIIYVAWLHIWHITNMAPIPTKSCHAPLPKIRNTGTWRWPADTHEEWNLFHEYLRLSITSRIAHIYPHTIKHRDKITYMKNWIINNIVHYIWIKQVKKKTELTGEQRNQNMIYEQLSIPASLSKYWKII